MGCEEFSGAAAELALGVLTGRARAEALAHVEECGACRETLRRLTLTAEELVRLLPAAEPPPGFETRVLDRLGMSPPARRRGFRYRKVLAAAAVTAAVVAAGLGGWGLRGAEPRGPASPPLSSGALVSGGRGDVGQAYYYAGHARWMYMWADLPAGGDSLVTCQVRGAGGRYSTVASFRLNGGYGSWGSPVPEVSGPVTGARLLGPGGTVLAAARFLREVPRAGQEGLQRAGDAVQRLGPNGPGLDHRAADGTMEPVGVAPNDLTSASRQDWLAGTPWREYVPARIEPVG